jgi:hypothetical protein
MRLTDCILKNLMKTRPVRVAFLLLLLPCLLLSPACSYSTETIGKHLSAGDAPLDILYVTNRAPSVSTEGKLSYGASRGHSMAYGSVTLARKGTSLDVLHISKHGEFPQSPYPIELTHRGPRRVPAVVDAHLQATAALQGEVSQRLAKTKRRRWSSSSMATTIVSSTPRKPPEKYATRCLRSLSVCPFHGPRVDQAAHSMATISTGNRGSSPSWT